MRVQLSHSLRPPRPASFVLVHKKPSAIYTETRAHSVCRRFLRRTTTSNVWCTVRITHINLLSWCCNDYSATTYTFGLILAYLFVSETLLRRE
jgi:hypothetical protein